jgi:hypothetical protein
VKFMKFFACAAAAGIAAVSLAGSQDDPLVSFSTQGPDRYADGAVVADGECYALVSIAPGAEFGGINADGTAAADGTKVLAIVSAAKDGRCKEFYLQVAKDLCDGTSYQLVLLDTRKDGKPSVKNGRFDYANGRVNGYGVIEGAKIEVKKGATSFQPGVSASAQAEAGLASLIPADAGIENPVITGIDVRNGKVYLKVSGTSRLLDYNVAAAATPGELEGKEAADGKAKAGAAGEIEIEVELPEGRDAAFFKVGRAPLK